MNTGIIEESSKYENGKITKSQIENLRRLDINRLDHYNAILNDIKNLIAEIPKDKQTKYNEYYKILNADKNSLALRIERLEESFNSPLSIYWNNRD
jgi:hypothetical protein